MTRVSNENTRREFLRNTGRIAAASALASATIPHVHAAENNTIHVALIGCGGRGTGAAVNALSVKNGPIQLVAMADVFKDRLDFSYTAINKRFEKQVAVPEDRKFVGMDAYQKAMDCLKPGDVAIFGTPPGFRWVHLGYAVKKGLNVFMEKPVTVDGPSTRKMLAIGEESVKKNLKVGVGLMVRHCHARQALKERLDNGVIGDIVTLRAYRMMGPVGSFFSTPRPAGISELAWQIRRFHSFLWTSGGCFSDCYIHQIDECCWMKGAWPVKAQAVGARQYRNNCVDQNFDTYSVEYTFPDGTKFYFYGRSINGCYATMTSWAEGAKGAARITTGGHTPGKCRIYDSHDVEHQEPVWAFPQPELSPYQLEWDDLVDAIRQDKPYNEVRRGAEASLVPSMGRMAAHTGRVITYDQILNCPHEFAPNIDKLTMDSPAPVVADAQGKYPVPMPGVVVTREF